jgi:hypothetical protein
MLSPEDILGLIGLGFLTVGAASACSLAYDRMPLTTSDRVFRALSMMGLIVAPITILFLIYNGGRS